jgi:AcrR family transcriptional regulator
MLHFKFFAGGRMGLKMQDMTSNPEALRQKMIDAGCELFSKIGYNETTIRMITDKAEIDIRCFYYLFESKEDLLGDVVQQLADSEAAAFDRIVSGFSDPLVKLAAMLNEMFSFRSARELMIGHVKKRYVIVNYMFKERIMEKAGPLVERVIAEGMKRGLMHTLEPAQTALLILNNMIFVLSGLLSSDGVEKGKMLKAFFHMTEASLGIEAGTLNIGEGCLEPVAE